MTRRFWVKGSALVAVGLACAAVGCEGRPRSAAPESGGGSAKKESLVLDGPAIAEIDLSHGAPEARSSSLLGSPSRRSFVDLVRVLRGMASGRDAPKGVFLRLGGGVGLARSTEIGALLGTLRQKVPVVCHADEYDNATMLLASRACSKLWVSPAGGVETIGLAAQMLYGNKLLAKLNIAVDFLQVGKYKGAEEPFTRDGPSPEARASLEGTLRGLRTAWLDGIVEGRAGKSDIANLAEDGPFSAEDAAAKGLVDAVGYLEEARDDAKKQCGTDRAVSRFGGSGSSPGGSRGLVGVLRAISGSGGGGSARVAVVPAVGSITMTGSTSLLGGGDGISERELGKVLTRLTDDSSTKAVVVRIDSPGGSALASDLLWKKLMKLRAKKTLVFSVGEMAASGGYYMACTANKIVAEPASIVGSIGVVGGKLAFGRALEDFGIHAETIPAAPDPTKAARASYMSAMTPWDQATRDKVLGSMRAIYDLFLKRVAEGRGTAVDKIAPSAEGQIFGGLEAKERGLVDEIGGLSDAIDLAIKLAGLPKDAAIDVVGNEPGLLELLEDGDGVSSEDRTGPALEQARRTARAAMLPGLAEAMPEVGAFVGSVAPLVAGERAVTALPFGLTIR